MCLVLLITVLHKLEYLFILFSNFNTRLGRYVYACMSCIGFPMAKEKDIFVPGLKYQDGIKTEKGLKGKGVSGAQIAFKFAVKNPCESVALHVHLNETTK